MTCPPGDGVWYSESMATLPLWLLGFRYSSRGNTPVQRPEGWCGPVRPAVSPKLSPLVRAVAGAARIAEHLELCCGTIGVTGLGKLRQLVGSVGGTVRALLKPG